MAVLDPNDEAERMRRRYERIESGQVKDADMVRVFSIAGFEVADIMAHWEAAWSAHANGRTDPLMDQLGPPRPGWRDEPAAAFGDRIARGLIVLLKIV